MTIVKASPNIAINGTKRGVVVIDDGLFHVYGEETFREEETGILWNMSLCLKALSLTRWSDAVAVTCPQCQSVILEREIKKMAETVT